MAPSATTSSPPPPSALSQALMSSTATSDRQGYEHPAYLLHLAQTILHNLQYQHSWTSLQIHTCSSAMLPLPRPMISGLPPKRAYIHPDEQAEIIKAEHEAGTSIEQFAEREWVLPTSIGEKWSLKRFTGVFDALDVVPPTEDVDGEMEGEGEGGSSVGSKWRGANRQKRLLLSTLHDDSTVVYYIMHDGIVKPRQN
ncbi:tRNA-intron endonuclease sen15 [Hyphodiscus hymeniophilus]|uniref:tRNA-intron endonuclease sen15 n=1 Tax=Hyphodiscus hymeniophilus TaxID=353542 RepID=A0A9P7AV61_9HELO|nr:tRNA-intron endonuclease sen15 [Hyphodiscus hymeniophilus]